MLWPCPVCLYRLVILCQRLRFVLTILALYKFVCIYVCVRLFLCLSVSVTSRCSTKTDKNLRSNKQHHTIPRNSSFLMPKISAKLDRGHTLRGRQMQVGRVKIDDFRQITGYISKTVQDRRTFSIKVE